MRSVQFTVEVRVFLQGVGVCPAALTPSWTVSLVTLLGEDMSPDLPPPPGVAGAGVGLTAARAALLLVLTEDVLRHRAPSSLQSSGVVGRVA